MTHSHHHDVEVVDRGAGVGAGLLAAIAAVLVLLIIALAVLWAAPWDDDDAAGGTPDVPGITDDSGGVPGGGDADSGSEGGTGGGGEGGTGGGEQPAQ